MLVALAYPPPPSGSGERTLDILLANDQWVSAVLVSLPRGVFRGMEAKAEAPAFLPVTAQGTIAYLYMNRYLGEELDKLGFVQEDCLGQRRYLAPVTTKKLRLRLTVSSATLQETIATVRARGPVTRALVDENAPLNPQLVMTEIAEEVDGGIFVNVWLFAQLTGKNRLEVWASLVGEMNDKGDKLTCWDQERLGTIDMNSYEQPISSIPDSIINVPRLEDLDGTNG